MIFVHPMMRIRVTHEAVRLPNTRTRVAVALCWAIVLSLIPAGRHTEANGLALSARTLALPRTAFPKAAQVQQSAPKAAQLTAISGLHTQALATLGWLGGSMQTASWQVAVGARRDQVTMRYSASKFRTAGQAARAYGDALASLWEIGETLDPDSVSGVAFRIGERQYTQLDLVLHRKTVEAELRVRYRATATSTTKNLALTALQRADRSAVQRITQLTKPLPNPAADTSLPPIYVAPAGTGPVAKSPSLMVMSGTLTDPASPADPGGFRSGTSPPPLAAKVVQPATLTPLGGLARFVRTLSDSGTTWYSSATLYSDAPSASAALHTLQAANATQQPIAAVTLPGVDESSMWQVGGETIFAYRCENVVGILAGSPTTPNAVAGEAAALVASVPTWLHAAGTQIVSATGQPVHLAALNWYGAEEQDFVVGGLDYQTYQSILATALSLGYNSIRLPYSDQLVEQNPIVTDHVRANPELAGLHALDILDRIIGYAGALGLRVVLDNHRSEAGWSAEDNGLWYTAAYPEASFIQDWTTLATRYAASNTVIGADLRNEPHATATWGDGSPATDWRAAAQRAGDAVLGVNPHLLIIVEGVQFYGNGISAWWGSNLMGVATAPVELKLADESSARSQLVYSAHDYGPNNCASGCVWFNSTATYASLSQVWDQYFGYIAADPNASYAAPVWMGEFGTCNFQQQCVSDSTPGSQGQWFSSLVRYLGERHLGWAYWSLNGTQSTGGQRSYGALEYYGLLQRNWSAPSPWVHSALQGILRDPGQQS